MNPGSRALHSELSYPLSHLLSLGSTFDLVFLGSLPCLHLWFCSLLFRGRVSLCRCLSFSSAGLTSVSHCVQLAYSSCFSLFSYFFLFWFCANPDWLQWSLMHFLACLFSDNWILLIDQPSMGRAEGKSRILSDRQWMLHEYSLL